MSYERTYVTLGSDGTNHAIVLRTHLGVQTDDARMIIFEAGAKDMLARCVAGDATHLMIRAAHPDAAEIVAKAQYGHGILITETFIAASAPLTILARRHITRPRSIVLHPATRIYTSLSDFEEVIEVSSTVAAYEGLVEGEWDSALTQSRFADENVTILREIEAARDA